MTATVDGSMSDLSTDQQILGQVQLFAVLLCLFQDLKPLRVGMERMDIGTCLEWFETLQAVNRPTMFPMSNLFGHYSRLSKKIYTVYIYISQSQKSKYVT